MPALREVNFRDTTRLISTQYTEQTALASLDLPPKVLSILSELDAATNERKIAEMGGRLGIGIAELVYGIPEATLVNAAFCHPGLGARFHGRLRGAWYAGIERETAMAEVRFHRERFLREMRATGSFRFAYRAFLADFAGPYPVLTEADAGCLATEPYPVCYARPQALARSLLEQGAAGIVYPSTRRAGGTCVVCFRPALVYHVRRGNVVEVEVSL
jgi:RES domain